MREYTVKWIIDYPEVGLDGVEFSKGFTNIRELDVFYDGLMQDDKVSDIRVD